MIYLTTVSLPLFGRLLWVAIEVGLNRDAAQSFQGPRPGKDVAPFQERNCFLFVKGLFS